MADDQKTIRTIVGYSVDQASVNQVQQSGDTVRGVFKSILDGVKSLDATGGSVALARLNSTIGDLNSRFENQSTALADWRKELEDTFGDVDNAKNATVSWIGELDELRQGILDASQAANDAQSNSGSSGGGAGASGLRRSGAALSQLGLGEIGRGVSLAGDLAQLDKFKSIISDLSPSAIAAGGAVVGLTAVIDLYTRAQKEAAKAASEEISGRQKAIELLATGTREEQQDELNRLETQRKNNAALAADTNQLFQNLKQQTLENLGPAAAAAEYYAAQVGQAAGQYQAAYDAAKNANSALDSTNTEMNILAQGSGLAAQGLSDIADQANRIHILSADISNRAAGDLEAYRLANDPSATTKQLDSRIRDLQLEIAVTQNSALAAQSRADALGRETKEGQAAIAEMNKLNDQAASAQSSLEALTQSFVRTDVAANEAKATQDKIQEDEATATQKYVDTIKSIKDKEAQSEIDLWTKLTDQQVAIADKAKDDVQKALDALATKESSLQTDLNRSLESAAEKNQFDSLQRQIKYYRQEAAEEQKTRDKIADIQRKASEDEFELGLDRNFSQLAASRRQTAQNIAQVNIDAQRDRQARLQAYQDQNTDDQAQYIFERQQRIKKYQQDIDDAKAAEKAQLDTIQKEKVKQLAAAQTAYNKELAALRSKLDAELQQQASAIQAQLQQIAAGEAGKLQIITTYANAAKQILQGIFDVSNLPSNPFANTQSPSGGSRGSTPTQGITNSRFPGFGAFGAAVPANAASNRSVSVNIPVTLVGANPATIATTITKIARDVVADTLERINRP